MTKTPSAPVAVIAGAGDAARATALELADAGYTLVILDRHADKARAIAAEITATHGRAHGHGHGVDLLDLEAVTRLRSDILAEHHRIDVLVHLVGGWQGTKTLEPGTVDAWGALHPRLVGTLAVTSTVLAPDIATSPHGRIILVSSTAVDHPTAGNIAYAAAKAAAETWMRGIADHLTRHGAPGAAVVTIVVKALLTDAMRRTKPDRDWPGFTPVDTLATAIRTAVTTTPADRYSRVDLTHS